MASDSTRWVALFALGALAACSPGAPTSPPAAGSAVAPRIEPAIVPTDATVFDAAVFDARRKNVELVDAEHAEHAPCVCKPPEPTIDAPAAPSCATSIANPRSAACVKQYCAKHADDIRCQLE